MGLSQSLDRVSIAPTVPLTISTPDITILTAVNALVVDKPFLLS